jgi:hypothetical protein
MDEAFARRAVEQLDRALPVDGRCSSGAGLLQGGAEGRALSAITDRGRARLPKVLGRRCNSWQGMDSSEAKSVSVLNREA